MKAILLALTTAGCGLVNEPDLSFLDEPAQNECTYAEWDPTLDTCNADGQLRTCAEENVIELVDCAGECEGGYCTTPDGIAQCACPDACAIAGIDCAGHGQCVGEGADLQCECDPGWVEAADAYGPTCVEAPPVELCDVPGDEDADGFSDCADFDCASAAECCVGEEPAAPVVDVNFGTEGVETGLWERFAPAGDRPEPSAAPGTLDDLGAYPEGNGIFWAAPVDFSGGLDVTLIGTSEAGDLCDNVAGCPDWIGVAFTRVRTFVEGVPLPTSLGVHVAPGGRVLVVRGGVVRQRGAIDPGGFRLRVRLTPSTLEGASGYAVEVSAFDFVNPDDPPTTVYSSLGPLLSPEDDLQIDGTQGARFAVVGRTVNPGTVSLSAVQATPRACANPSGWSPLGSVGPADIGLDAAEWAAGSIGSPSAAPTGAGEEVRLLFDASNLDPFFEIYGDVRKSIGELTFQVVDGAGEFSDAVGPVIGQDPPNCVEEPCPAVDPDEPLDARRPGIFRSALGTFGWVVEADGTEIQIHNRGAGAWDPFYETPLWTVETWGLEAFTGVAAAERESDGALCVFVAGRAVGLAPDLYALCAADLDSLLVAEVPVSPLLPSASLGPIAARGIDTAAVLFDDAATPDDADDVFRIWAVVEDAAGRSSLAHAIVAATLDPSAVQAYTGNPVLRPESEFLEGCGGECRFSGVGVVQFDLERRFFLGRQEDAESTRFEIFALSQRTGGG